MRNLRIRNEELGLMKIRRRVASKKIIINFAWD